MADPTNPSSYFGAFPGTVYGTYGPPQPPSLFGFNPSAPSSALEGALQSLTPLLSEFLRSKTGGFGFNFGSDMNIAQSQFAREFMQQMMAARGQGAAADTGQVNDLLRGMAAMIGHKSIGRDSSGRLTFDRDTEAAIGRMSSDAGAMLPILASMFPDYVDRALPRGSMTVASGSFVNAGRFLVDPLTGRPISEDVGYAARVLNPLMSRGAEATYGLGAGRLGQTFEALAANGLIDTGADLRKMVESGDMSGERAREVQSDRVRDQIQRYSKTVAAINDIFAESGRPNAPMKELINGLQAMTQGGINTYDSASLERIVRSLHGTSQLTGIGLGGLQEMTIGAAALLGRYGGHRALAPLITRYAAAMGGVYTDGGFGLPSPEGMSRDEWNATVAGKRAAGAGSDFGNMIGALLAQADIAGADTPLGQLAVSLRAGGLAGGGVDLRTATQADLTALMTRSGLDPGAFNAQMRATGLNQAMLVRGGGGLMRALDAAQTAEFDARFTQAYGMDLSQRGIDVEKLMTALHDVAAGGGLESDVQFVSRVGDRLGLTPAQRSVLTPYVSEIGKVWGTSGYNAFAMNSPDVRARAAANEQRFIERGEFLSDVAHLGRRGWIGNAAYSILRRAGFEGPADTLLTTLRGFGMVTDREVNEARMRGPMGVLAGTMAASMLTGNLGDVGPLVGLEKMGEHRTFVGRTKDWVLDELNRAEKNRREDANNPWKGGGKSWWESTSDAAGAEFEERSRRKAAARDMNVSMQVAVLKITREGGTLTGEGSASL